MRSSSQRVLCVGLVRSWRVDVHENTTVVEYKALKFGANEAIPLQASIREFR